MTFTPFFVHRQPRGKISQNDCVPVTSTLPELYYDDRPWFCHVRFDQFDINLERSMV